MKLVIKNNKVSLSGLTVDEANAIIKIVDVANRRCFREPSSGWDDKQEDGRYYSGSDFVCVISENEREALYAFCKSLDTQLAKLK